MPLSRGVVAPSFRPGRRGFRTLITTLGQLIGSVGLPSAGFMGDVRIDIASEALDAEPLMSDRAPQLFAF